MMTLVRGRSPFKPQDQSSQSPPFTVLLLTPPTFCSFRYTVELKVKCDLSEEPGGMPALAKRGRLLVKTWNNTHFPMCFPEGLSLSKQADCGFSMQLKFLLCLSPSADITSPCKFPRPPPKKIERVCIIHQSPTLLTPSSNRAANCLCKPASRPKSEKSSTRALRSSQRKKMRDAS